MIFMRAALAYGFLMSEMTNDDRVHASMCKSANRQPGAGLETRFLVNC
jgi:hypothetical protein